MSDKDARTVLKARLMGRKHVKYCPTVLSGCMDCDLVTKHRTLAEAVQSVRAHVVEWPEHRGLVSDDRGWHRCWPAAGASYFSGDPL